MTPLRRARGEKGWTKAKLVALIEQTARTRGDRLNKTTSSLNREVSFWESGQRNPQEPVLGILCAIYDKTPHELGLSPTPDQASSDVGLIYAPSLSEAVQTLSKLTTFDLSRHTSVSQGAYSVDALNAACMDWLFTDSRFDVEVRSNITSDDVAAVKSAASMFDGLDRQGGGEASRLLGVRFLHDKVVPLLSVASTDADSRALFSAAATLCEVIGWMAYDDERHRAAQRYFVQALRLSKDADEPAYGAYVLTTMSHQALYLNRPEQALRFALAAKAQTAARAVPMVQAEAAMSAARAYALLGNEGDCATELAEAERVFATARPETTPAWASHWSEAVFATYVGTCWVDLKKPAQAYEPLRLAWDAAKDQPRRRAFSTGQLARVAALNGDIEQAASLGIAVVETTSRSASRRTLQVVRDVGRDLQRHRTHRYVRDFEERARMVLAG
jgi:tetratricopeptide (TPR) repeat protein